MLKLARVVEVHPESHSVDVVVLDDNRRFSGVKVLAGAAGGDYGFAGLAVPTNTGYDAKNSGKRDVFALVAWAGYTPIVMGFLHPAVSQMLFPDKNRMVYRHPSDAYMTVDPEGNAEFYHPSGAYIRIGTEPAHEDLSGKDYEGAWAIERNTDKAVHIHIEQSGGKASVDIDPDGNVLVISPHVKFQTPTAVVTGNLSVHGDIAAGGNIGANGDVVSAGGAKSLSGHKHDGVHGPTSPPIGSGTMPALED